MSENAYDKLIKKLESMPIGIGKIDGKTPESFIKLLKMLYTPEEAEIISNLEFFLEPVHKIAKKLAKNKEETLEILNNLADKGLIFRYRKKDKVKFSLFNAANIFDYPFLRNEPIEKMKTMAELAMDWFDNSLINEAFGAEKTGIYRVLPVEEKIEPTMEVMSYETVSGLIDSMSNLTIIPCVCRRRMELIDKKPCDYPTEKSCLTFGSTGKFFQEMNYGKSITKEEAKKLFKEYQENGLVLMTTNSQEKILVICACCKCCCVGLRGLLEFKKPAAVVGANFQVEVNKELCTGCGNCVERCVFGANQLIFDENLQKKISVVDLDKCLGCGLCTIKINKSTKI
ncbi:MAG: ATP-binding protein [Candidatus Helarchaeota archaeon]